MTTHQAQSRRRFLQSSGALLAASAASHNLLAKALVDKPSTPKISAHLWVYASAHPPAFDATPDLERAFSDLQFAGFDGVELMAVVLRHDDAVERISALAKKYKLPITGCSFSGDMWDATKHDTILKDAEIVLSRLHQLNGKTFGLSVGNAKHIKTETELDAQSNVLKELEVICAKYGVEPNLHNHTYEVENDMHDLKGTLARLPNYKLGPDLNWLVRGGVDPVAFINTYASQMVYMHIRDQYADGTWTEYLGQGVTNFKAIAAALKANRFKGRAAVELAFPDKFVPQHPLSETWKLSRDYVKTTFGW